MDMDIDRLAAEAIALTDKKMDMTLDDIIKMSKRSSRMKRSAARKKYRRAPIRSQASRSASNGNSKIQNFMDSRSALRQSVLATKRSNYRENQFPIVSEAVKEAVHAPFNRTFYSRNNQRQRGGLSFTIRASGAVNGKDKLSKQRTQTLDDRFASMTWKKILKAQEIIGLQNAKRRPVQHRLGAVLQREQRPGREQWSDVAGLRAARRPVLRRLGGFGLKTGQRSYVGQRLSGSGLKTRQRCYARLGGFGLKTGQRSYVGQRVGGSGLKTRQRSYAGQRLGGSGLKA